MKLHPVAPPRKRFLITSIIPHFLSQQEAFQNLKELKALVDAYGGQVVDYVLQNREVHDKGLYLGRGKIEEIADMITDKNIHIIVLNAIVKPGHLFDIKQTFGRVRRDIEVWDRADLILQIFSRHANTTEARLQIELAAMRHMGPRIYGMGYVLSRQGGSIGTRGIGETNTELMKRHWRNQMKKTQEKLEKLTGERERQLARRRKMGLKTVSLVGYTNAGKTSLFNLLTGKKQLVKNELFATLDSHVGKILLKPLQTEIILSDTIGFIRNLPPTLIDAFNSTLMESINSDLLLHVVDSSDEDIRRKIDSVEEVLSTLHIFHKKTILVFNKADQLTVKQLTSLQKTYSLYQPVFVSVKKQTGIEKLTQTIYASLNEREVVKPRKRVHFEFPSNVA